MKKLAIFVTIYAVILGGCTSKELSREEALNLIRQEMHYPKVFDFEINRVDQNQARKVLDAELEAKGLVTVQRTQKLLDIGKPLIHFTDKAKPFFLPLPQNENPEKVQVVKLADEELAEVTGIKTSGNRKNAVVEYTTAYNDITPFAALVNRDFNKKEVHKAYFSLYDEGWRYEKKPGVEFIELEK